MTTYRGAEQLTHQTANLLAMTDCDYCSESFEDEGSYLTHLKKEHEGELSKIDQRRVDEAGITIENPVNIGLIIIVGVTALAFAMVGYLIFAGGAASGDEPHGSTHEHGTLSLEIDGEPIDFSQPEYVEQDGHFHFHGYGEEDIGDGSYLWHTHSHGVTIEYALETLDIDIADDGSGLTVGGETYDATEPDTEISVTVDGTPVDPGEYELSGVSVDDAADGHGDDVEIVVDTGDDEDGTDGNETDAG